MFKVAILGFGVVGSGTGEVLLMNSEKITHEAGDEVELKYIVDIRDIDDPRFAKYAVKDFSVALNDPEVTIIAETIGGAGVAYEYTKAALLAGKHVVTSNKELVAKHGVELLEIALKNNINYLFEASVGGGIPILRPIQQCLSANRITEVYGILNGTTNYILTAMSEKGASFEDALAEAQKNGYAEANPSADVDGIDALRKICILSDLCFGKNFSPDLVQPIGIRPVSEYDTKYANQGGYKIKLLGRAVSDEATDKVAVYVAPHLVSSDNLLASVTGVMNGIVVRGNALGDVMFYGAGAGKMPTASAVVADIIDCCRHTKNRKRIMWARGSVEDTFPSANIASRWYARVASPEGTVKKYIPDAEILGGDVSQTGFIADEKTKPEVERQLEPFEVLSLFRVI